MTTPAHAETHATGNLFLDTLPSDSLERVRPMLEHMAATASLPIAAAGSPIAYAVFPLGCVVSGVARMQDGSDIEVALIGREGFFGSSLVLGAPESAVEAMVQIPNGLLRLPATDFLECLKKDDDLRQRALRYVSFTIDSLGQFAACNRLHAIEARAARWLLMAHDRVATDEVLLTQEYLATMLGVRRPGVSVAAAALETAGLIRYHRGRIQIVDRDGLESVSCECYGVVNDALVRHMGYDVRKSAPNGAAARAH